MYQAIDDPYCYKGTTVLKNRLGIRDQISLDDFEAESTASRFLEELPAGRLSVTHYKALHRHIFQDVYAWAGQFRTVRISKDNSTFAYPENIAHEMFRVFRELKQEAYLRGLKREAFIPRAAYYLSEINAIHPFRDGNGRVQLTFLTLLAYQAGYDVDTDKIDPTDFLNAMIESFQGRMRSLEAQLARFVD